MATQRHSLGLLIRLSISGIVVATVLISIVHLLTPLIRSATDRAGYLSDLPLDAQYYERIVVSAKLALAEQKHDADVWAFGDSSCLFGLDPQSFRSTSGLDLLNLGTFGYMGTDGHDALLTWMLEKYAPPSAIVLWVHPETLAMSTSRIEQLGYQGWLRERLQPGYDPFGGIPVLASANDIVGGLLRTVLLGQGGWDRLRHGESLRPRDVNDRLMEHDGWFPTQSMQSPDYNSEYGLDSDQIPGLHAFARHCSDKQIPLFLFVMPVVDKSPITETEYDSTVQRIREELGAAKLLPLRTYRVPWQRMQTKTHFAAAEARETSVHLGLALVDSLSAAPRW